MEQLSGVSWNPWAGGHSLRKSGLGKLRTEQCPHIIPASLGTFFFFSLSGD